MAKGFKCGSSGGYSLNFDVVPGATRPTAPKENTIWANSSDSTASWVVSPTEPHRVSRTTNLVVYPYLYGTRTNSGVTFTVDDSAGGKGKITVNGTNTSSGSIVYRLSDSGVEKRELLLQPGEYCLCGNCANSSASTHRLTLAYTYDDWATTGSVYDNSGTGESFTLTKVAKARVSIQVMAKQAVSNAVYWPQIERGATATNFTLGDASGQVWVKTDPASEVLLNIVKKNSVYIKPSAVYEYTTGDGWALRNGEVYQRDAWAALEEPWDGYYFKDGELYTDITGGWTSDGWGNTGAVNIGSTITLSGNNAQAQTAKVGTAQPVDLTGARTLWYDSPSGNNGQPYGGFLCVTKAKSIATTDVVTLVTINNAGEGSVDVSGLSGEYYVCLYATAHTAGTAYVDVRAIWIE